MSINSGLTRAKDGTLVKDGKPYVVALNTGDDTPVKVDERFDVDLNKLVSNEMARQDLIRIPGAEDMQDLREYPASRGEAAQKLEDARRRIVGAGVSVESGYEAALRASMVAVAQEFADKRKLDAMKAVPKPVDEPKPSEVPPKPAG